MDYCDQADCDRPVFTKKSGMCQRHYDRARTARLAAERPAAPLVRDTPCRECGTAGYHRVEDGVLCRAHWDRLRRRGTVEPARANNVAADVTCSEQHCAGAVHSRGLCQPHYRQARRREVDPLVGQRKTGPKPKAGSESHKRLSDEEKDARIAERKASKTNCVHGHELTVKNTYVTAKGQKICRLCQRRDQQQFMNRPVTPDTVPVGPRNAEKTHCPQGHPYALFGREKNDGARFCTICHRAGRVRRAYGMEPELWDALVVIQQGRCDICSDTMKEPHVDHDHATGHVRGLLCTGCNNGLGRFKDNPDLLEAAAFYLRNERMRTTQGAWLCGPRCTKVGCDCWQDLIFINAPDGLLPSETCAEHSLAAAAYIVGE